METKIKEFNVNWLTIKNACRQTVSMGDSKVEPTEEWKRKLLVCRHSPLRVGTILWQSEDVPFYVMGHMVRHNVGCTPFVSTSREDRTGIPREERKQTDNVNLQMVANIESILNISEKRLCNCADINTIKYWKQVLEAIKEYDKDIVWACAPSGIVHGGCTEPFSNCNMCNKILEEMPPEDRLDITKRYNYYQEKVKRLELKK